MQKPNRKPKPQSVDHYFDCIAKPDLQELALALRNLIKRTLPDVHESLKWELPFYMCQGNLCYINIQKSTVVLGLYRGIHLSNANGLLQGDGNLIKHVVLYPADDIPAEGIKEILLEAKALNEQGPLKLKLR